VSFDTYNPTNPDHLALVSAVTEAETLAAQVDVSGVATFQKARRLIRTALDRAGIIPRIEDAVSRVLPPID